jgi:uncharacterized protein involved in response to NO
LIGGRVTPSFTGNWFAKAGITERPAPFGRPDGAVLGLSALSLAFWVVAPEGVPTGDGACGGRCKPLAAFALAWSRCTT